jgi:ABC-2 type transport system permease protein
MNKTMLIFRHEFTGMLKRTGFIIMTFIVPLLALLGIFAYQIISGSVKPAEKVTSIGYIDKTGSFMQYTDQGKIKMVPFTAVTDANQRLGGNDIKGYFVITQDYLDTGIIEYFTLEKQIAPPQDTLTAIKNFLTGNMLAGKVSQTTIDRVEETLKVASVRLTTTGEFSKEQGGVGNLLIPTLFAVLLVMSITFSSSYLIQGMGDEKENRLIEVLLSSVSVRELLIGKVLGLGIAGLLQVVVWVVCAPLILNLAGSSIGGVLSTLHIQPIFLVLCIVYFILGYLLFSMISLAIGAVSPSAREGQQLATIFTLSAVCPLWFASAILLFPNSPAWVALTIFPLTAPVTLMLRLGATDVAPWQIITSILVLLASGALGLMLTARIVRTFLLMYGKRPNLGQIIRNLRNS